ncbi:MAG TPA: Fur family transcriptional regulator [Fimbriimonadaceae bacterium]|nr:Fur family transcriptional regulator [Fimbriimonadaceae bacterium]
MVERSVSTGREDPQHTCNESSRERKVAFEEIALEALRDAGFRVTMPRVQVIRALGESNRPLTANEIHQRIQISGGRIDSVSVYRILSTLQAVGAVHRIGVVDAFYACGLQTDQAHDTQHFVCESCGCVTEVNLPLGASTSVAEEAAKVGFLASEIRLEVLGRCRHCQKAA